MALSVRKSSVPAYREKRGHKKTKQESLNFNRENPVTFNDIIDNIQLIMGSLDYNYMHWVGFQFYPSSSQNLKNKKPESDECWVSGILSFQKETQWSFENRTIAVFPNQISISAFSIKNPPPCKTP